MDGIAPADLYERDFYAWTQDQAARLRALGPRNDGLDVENLAEEVESLGKSDRRAAESLLGNIIEHLLKLRLHPDQRAREHWISEVEAFRDQLERIFRDSPSLRARRQDLADGMSAAVSRRLARQLDAQGHAATAVEVRLRAGGRVPFDLDAEVLNEGWFPDPPAA